MVRILWEFLRVSIIKNHNLSLQNNHKYEGQESSVVRARLPLKTPRVTLLGAFLWAHWCCSKSLQFPWLVDPSLLFLPPCVCFCVFLQGHQSHWDWSLLNQVWHHLNWIISTEALSSTKIPVVQPRSMVSNISLGRYTTNTQLITQSLKKKKKSPDNSFWLQHKNWVMDHQEYEILES